MTLLSFLRTENDLSNLNIIRMLRDKKLSTNWSARTCSDFLDKLRNKFPHHGKIVELISDIRETEELYKCNDCYDWGFADDMRSCYEGDFLICEGCCEDNYTYSDYRDTYVHYEDCDEDDYENQESSGAYNYEHRVEDDLGFLSLPHEKHSNDTIYYGVELEVERRKDCPYLTAH